MSRPLLDTHAWVWWICGDARLSAREREALDNLPPSERPVLAEISLWEVAMLVAKGRLHLEQTPMQWRRTWLAAGLAEWPLSGAIGIGAVHLDGLHGDPADRWIVATALDLGAELLTADERLLAWAGPLTCVDARR